MVCAWLLLASTTRALGVEGIEAWEHLHDALLLEAADGDAEGAIAAYEQLVRNLPAWEPTRAEALYQLAQIRYAAGDVDGTREALREGVRTGIDRDRFLELLGRVELEQGSIREIPVRWTFDQPHGFIHPWRFDKSGSLRVLTQMATGDAVLAWTTRVALRTEDQILVGFREPTPPPRGVRFSATSQVFDGWIRVILFDSLGHKHGTAGEPILLPRGVEVDVELELDELVPLDAGVPLSPGDLERLVIQDVTAYLGEATGTNEILLDDFEVY